MVDLRLRPPWSSRGSVAPLHQGRQSLVSPTRRRILASVGTAPDDGGLCRQPASVTPAKFSEPRPGVPPQFSTQASVIHLDGALQRSAMACISFCWSNLKRRDLP